MPGKNVAHRDVAQLRAFNRFWAPRVGATSRRYLATPLTLAEARVLYEVGKEPGITAATIRKRVPFHQGHLSRVVARLASMRLVQTRPGLDRREQAITPTPAGARLVRLLERRADAKARAELAPLRPGQRREALACLARARDLLDAAVGPREVTLREGRVGDLGWAFQRQSVMYKDEFGYAAVFETYVARGLAPFLDHFDGAQDRLWIAERDGAPIGCIAIQHDPDRAAWAKLRWFFVEGEARGLGAGKRLLAAAVAFSRRAGYDGIYLWTVDDLHAARRLYEAAGFLLAETTDGCAWAPWGREQRWELKLRGPPPKP